MSPVVAKEAHTDGTRVVQCQSDDQNSMKTTIMQMPMDYLEIPEPSLPRGFLELAEETRNVNVEIEQCCYTDEVQTQEAGLTRPAFVTVMEYSSSVLNVGATIAPGISTERIPPIFSAGRRSPVDQLGLVGPSWAWFCPDRIQKMEEPTLLAQWAQMSQLAEGPVGQYITHSPVGSDGMLSTCDSDQPMAEGPVGQYITRSPVGSDGMLSTCDSDQQVADGPVGQSFTPGPVGPCGIVSKCKPNDPIADSLVGSTETPDPVDQKERPIQIDIMKIVTTDEPASLVGTPPQVIRAYTVGENNGKI